jgi:type I restriction enzyme S subunit
VITGLRPYPAMKDSGVPWLGDVPEHWEVAPMKRLASFKGGAGFPVDQQGQRDLELPFFKVSDMNLPGNGKVMAIWNNTVSRSTASNLGAAVFPPGAILFPKVGGAMLTNKRRVVERGCCIDNNLMGCVVRRGDPRFVLLLLELVDFAMIAKPGPVPAISEGEVREIRAVLPPLPEQAAIVRFLDHADRRIRRYIRAKQKLIKLLEEQKQGVIHRAVTRGLDPYVRLKPSGLEWLGDVPEHWEVAGLRRRWRVTDCKHLTVPFVDDGIPLASVREAQSFEGGRKPQTGDLIYCRNVSVGAAALVTKDDCFAMGQDVCLIRSAKENQRWLNYFLRSKAMSDQLALILVGSTFNRINVADIKALLIAAPPRAEQDRIAEFLDGELTGIDSAIGICRGEQELLREYRTRLIADVVTGKLDVREAAARLTDETEESEPLDEADALTDAEEDAADLDAIPEEAEA